MLKITNGKDIFEVTTGAYEDIYKGLGYIPVDNGPDILNSNVPPVGHKDSKGEDGDSGIQDNNSNGGVKTEDEIFCEELLKTPIDQWNKDQIVKFSAINGINISGTKSSKEAKDIIRKFLAQ